MNHTKMMLYFLLLPFLLLYCCSSEKGDKKAEPPEGNKPNINQLIPNTGYHNDIIKVVGDNFGADKNDILLRFGDETAEIISLSDKLITVVVPFGKGSVNVSVKIKNELSNSSPFLYREIEDDPVGAGDKIRIKAIIENPEPANWVFTGNSITQGAKHTHGMRPYSEIFAERIRWEMQRTDDVIINTAISGHTSLNIINDFDIRVSWFNPKVVVLMIGTNDADQNRNISIENFKSNLIQLIDQIRESGAIPVIMSPGIIITQKSPERNKLYLYVEKMREAVKTKDVIFVDNWNIWINELDKKYNGEVFKKLLNDPLHPNGYGHKEIAYALFKELSIFDPNAPTCGGEYYEGDH